MNQFLKYSLMFRLVVPRIGMAVGSHLELNWVGLTVLAGLKRSLNKGMITVTRHFGILFNPAIIGNCCPFAARVIRWPALELLLPGAVLRDIFLLWLVLQPAIRPIREMMARF